MQNITELVIMVCIECWVYTWDWRCSYGINGSPVHHEVQSFLVQWSTVQCSAVHDNAAQYSSVHYTGLQYSTWQYLTMQYSTVHFTALHCPALHCTAVMNDWCEDCCYRLAGKDIEVSFTLGCSWCGNKFKYVQTFLLGQVGYFKIDPSRFKKNLFFLF